MWGIAVFFREALGVPLTWLKDQPRFHAPSVDWLIFAQGGRDVK